MTLTDRGCFAWAVVLYGLSLIYSIFLYRRGFRQHNRVNYALILIGFAFHTAAMFKRGFSLSRCPVNNLYEAMTFVDWTVAAAYLSIGLWSRLSFLGAFCSPLLFGMGVFALMPGLDVHATTPQFVNGWASLHAALILLAYGAFGLSSIAGAMYLMQERDLKIHKLRAVLSLLPSIGRLDHVVGGSLISGFSLLTLGLITGAYYLKQQFGVFYKSDPKILWSLFVWGLYFGLVTMRARTEQGGRKFAWGAVAAFIFVVTTFWGVNLLSPLHR